MDEEDQPRVAARAGRRARAAAFTAEDETGQESTKSIGRAERDDDSGAAPEERPSPGGGKGEEAAAPPAPRVGGFNMDSPNASSAPRPPAVGGFGLDNVPRGPRDPEIGADSTKYVGVSRRKQDQRQREEDEKLKAKNKYDEMVERAQPFDSIVEIEEEGKEDLTGVVAEAPKVRINRVQNITDLDEDMQFRLPSTDDRDIDLSILTSFLCSSEQVQEEDDVWDADMLFTNVASELHQEKERAEGVAEKDSKDQNQSDQL